MRINKHWNLKERNGKPRLSGGGKASSKEFFDACTIIHEPNDPKYTPIVLKGLSVYSKSSYRIRTFYRDVVAILHGLDEGRGDFFPRNWWAEERGKDFVRWGCREFTRKQLKEIKRAIEWHCKNEGLDL